ncbi:MULTISPECIES: hypothetical protein [unclassified Pseudoalteromonas]|uniref:hypothetical protein n=1 Tax=unclassified Pseudoalteromonas TaxID=194690 RepID=UPI00051928A7|nr:MULTISPECIES: hypothetical protein [unclassified Pseudoalteromonas]AZN33313.1 hypothetical protein EJ103_11600 [Pseudoalteromonas sp. Xi13]
MDYRKMKLKIVVSVLCLSGCSEFDDEAMTFLRCGIAANELDQHQAIDRINDKMGLFFKEEKLYISSRDASYMGAEIRNEEMQLYRKNALAQYATLVEVYNSSECVDLHEGEEINIPFEY